MAAYPSFNQHASSGEEVIDALLVERASDGTLRSRSLQSAPKRRFRVVHILGGTDKATLEAFYAANRTAADISFTWVPDATAYTCAFGAAPRFVPLEARMWRCEATLEQV